MSQPVQHHFLPERAYLKLFDTPDRPDYIYLYQRGIDPVLVNIEKAARERHLYTFENEHGEKSTDVEAALGQIEQAAGPVLRKLADASRELMLTLAEKVQMMQFIAFQAFRTPAQRDGIGKVTAEVMTKIMKTSGSGKSLFERTLDDFEKLHPELPKEGKEMALEGFMSGKIQVKIDPQYAMALALGPAIDVFPYLMMKEMLL